VCIDQHIHRDSKPSPRRTLEHVELLVVDEAERLSPLALEHLRDRFDRRHLGLILIGMPGIEKRLARYPQLYSRIGFAHHYQPLGNDELTFVLTRHWRRLGLNLDLSDFTDAQAVATIARITRGNFRLVQRLFIQIERIMKINNLTVITSDVIETARSTLVIGNA
jgi:DNA transposition AAA+ family ATPase